MKDSTETLIMFVQLLSAKPAILTTTALPSAEKLASELAKLPTTDLNQAAKIIRSWIKQFPEESKIFQKARELNKIAQPSAVTWTFPNLQIIEETDTDVIITPDPPAEQISLLSHLIQALNQWIQNNQNNQ
jgi:hypothetical protein